MATFQAKIGWKRLRMRENKNYRSISFLNDAQKRKKFKNTIMSSFQAKIGWKRRRKRENKKLSFRYVPSRQVIENSKKIVKKFKKFQNTIMGSFQAKIDWKTLRKIENKNYRSVTFLPYRLQKIRKKQQKNSKNLKIRLWDHFKPKYIGKD